MLDVINKKIVELPAAIQKISQWRNQGQKIVWTNGCFDLLHLGHITYLAQARDLGDRLIVGINSDASVQNLKGADRPIFDLQTRALKLAALVCTDLVIAFEHGTPIEEIKTLSPDILVKGGDYIEGEIVGAQFVKSQGGSVVIIPLSEGHSTSTIINKIRTNADK